MLRGLSNAPLLILALLLASVVPMPSTRASQAISATILFDLGDGTYYWSNVTVANPRGENASWNATITAAAEHNLRVKWVWFSQYHAIFVTDIGDRNPPGGPGLLVWNRTTGIWEQSALGISDLVLKDGDSLAWYDAAFDPNTYIYPLPVPTPDDAFPATQFRGDLRNTGGSISEAPNSNSLLWDHDTGVREVDSTPVMAYGRVFVATLKGLLALDARSGGEIWRNPGVRGMSTPALFNGTLIVGGADGRLHWVSSLDGRELRNVTLLTHTRFSGITSSPKVLYDRVFVGTFNESGGPGEVAALSVRDGTILWRHPTPSIHLSSAAIDNGTLYIGVMGYYNTTTQVTFDPPFGLLALNITDGLQRWFFPTGASVAASPTVHGSLVLFPAKDGFMHALDARGREVWRAGVGAGVSSAAVGDGFIFVGGGAFGGPGRIVALDSSGSVRWSFTPNGAVQGSIAYADHKVFFSTNTANGTIYGLNATTGALVWNFEPTPREFILGSPAIADGRLYAPSDNGHLYAFRDRAPALLNLTLTFPSSLSPGEEGSLKLAIRDIAGRGSGAVLTLALPAEALEVGATPTESRRSGNALVWDLGDIPFRGERDVVVRTRIDPGTTGGLSLRLSATLAYTDNDGTPYPPLYLTATMGVARAPPSPESSLPWIALGVVVLAAGIAAAVWVVRRRRGTRAP